jgi:hypothetical protein
VVLPSLRGAATLYHGDLEMPGDRKPIGEMSDEELANEEASLMQIIYHEIPRTTAVQYRCAIEERKLVRAEMLKRSGY